MRRATDGVVTGFIAAVVEAWHELRIHKLRVLLSLVGVMVAVASLTTAVAASQIAQQVIREQYEREGRPAMIQVYAHQQDNEFGGPSTSPRVREAFLKTAKLLKVDYYSMRGSNWEMRAARNGLTSPLGMTVVDPQFAVMHRTLTHRGRWLEAGDAGNMSPAVVVQENLLEKLGLAGVSLPVTIDIGTKSPVTVTVVGTVPRTQYDEHPVGYMLADAYEHWFGADQPLMESMYEMWVPPTEAEQMAMAIRQTMGAELPGYMVEAHRSDYLAWGGDEGMKEVTIVVSAIAGVILLLGALSLLNVALVTIQQRVREVGIRRSFGATTARVFFSVMMESVVATVVAGAVGVMISIALVRNPWTAEHLLDGIDDVPPFPVEAALLGLGVSVLVGALAGVLPALVAARVKIVDAIRF